MELPYRGREAGIALKAVFYGIAQELGANFSPLGTRRNDICSDSQSVFVRRWWRGHGRFAGMVETWADLCPLLSRRRIHGVVFAWTSCSSASFGQSPSRTVGQRSRASCR